MEQGYTIREDDLAGDAAHLAVAAEHGATVCTLDRLLADAGPQVGVPTRLLG